MIGMRTHANEDNGLNVAPQTARPRCHTNSRTNNVYVHVYVPTTYCTNTHHVSQNYHLHLCLLNAYIRHLSPLGSLQQMEFLSPLVLGKLQFVIVLSTCSAKLSWLPLTIRMSCAFFILYILHQYMYAYECLNGYNTQGAGGTSTNMEVCFVKHPSWYQTKWNPHEGGGAIMQTLYHRYTSSK